MAAPIPAVDLITALQNCYTNIHSLSESGIDLKPRLTLWRTDFFATINRDDQSQSFIHQWIVPTLALENKLSDFVQEWFILEEIFTIVSNTLSSAGFNGYVPVGAQEAAMVAAFNAAWT